MEYWRILQRQNFIRFDKLADFLQLDSSQRKFFVNHPAFPLNLPLRLAQKIKKKTLDDPILRQFLPFKEELAVTNGFSTDPVVDCSFQKTPSLLQKYQGRALLITTSACVMNCRFCFRQNYPYFSPQSFEKEIKALNQDPSIYEVILSGGDPLSLPDQKLEALILELETIPHLKLLRFHTRFPIGIPERITPTFLKILKKTRLKPIFILHINHPNELDTDIFAALKQLNTPLLSQTVLLRHINDDVDTLKNLFLNLVTQGIIPYYLHQLDRVQGAAHFEVPVEKGKELIRNLRAVLPGYAVPTYVQEIPHEKNKTLLLS